MTRHFTATTYLFSSYNQTTLLLFHPKIQKWVPPGGHVEANETPPEAARREVLEETGLNMEFIHQENVWVHRWNACSFERPYLCLLENIPAHQNTPAHQHMDFIYLARPTGGTLIESPWIRWLSLEDILLFESDKEIFEETKQVLSHLLGDESPLISTPTHPFCIR